MKNILFEKARKFVYRNARPLELTMFKYLFENGSQDNVLEILSAYQNEDGGFGHALEPDSWTPKSSPIATWMATDILRRINFKDKNHPIIKGILKYLESGNCFDADKQMWMNVIPENNQHPHAIWWQCENNVGEPSYNPTVCLAGFIICNDEKDSKLYNLACEIVKNAALDYISKEETEEMHIVRCFMGMMEYCLSAGETSLFDLEKLQNKLKTDIDKSICKDYSKWGVEYVSTPSWFIESDTSIFYEEHREAVIRECEFIKNSQLEDGSYPVTWQWYTDYKEFEVSKIWWKSNIIIKNLLFLKAMEKTDFEI